MIYFCDEKICDEIIDDLFSEAIFGESIISIGTDKNTKLQNYTTWKTLITSSSNGSDEEMGEFFI